LLHCFNGNIHCKAVTMLVKRSRVEKAIIAEYW